MPLATASFDLVVSEHGAAAWCDPERWLSEAARVLRPGGRLVFLTNSVLSALCVPDEEGVATPGSNAGSARPITSAGQAEGLSSIPPMAIGSACFAGSGSVVEGAARDLCAGRRTDHPFYEIVSIAWASQWPAEELWMARRV